MRKQLENEGFNDHLQTDFRGYVQIVQVKDNFIHVLGVGITRVNHSWSLKPPNLV